MRQAIYTKSILVLTIAMLLAPAFLIAAEPRLLEWDAAQLAEARRQIGADAFFANTDKGVKDKIKDLKGEDPYEI